MQYKSIMNTSYKIAGFTGFSLVLLSLGSCRSTDSENTLNSGNASVNINLLGTQFSNTETSPAQASVIKKVNSLSTADIQSHSILVNPSTIITAELAPESAGSIKNQASAGSNMMAAAGDPLGYGITFRVLAYKQSDGSYADSKDYIVGQPAGSLSLDQGTTYTIIAYSYGTAMLPAISANEKNNLNTAAISYDDYNRDFMYQKISFTPSSTTNTLNITLNHKVARITTVIEAASSFGKINSISNAALTPHYSNGNINLSDGIISNRTQITPGTGLDFSGTSFPTATTSARPVFINADTGGLATGSFSADINIGGTAKTINLANQFKITPGNNSTLKINFKKCGAYLGAGNTLWKDFMCHNLGADTNADPFTLSAAIQGAKYQWGAYTGESGRYYSQANDQTNTGTITGWSSAGKADGSWLDSSKTGNDPCPSGYRVPTQGQWQSILSNNSYTAQGTWTDSPTNYGSGAKIGNLLFLPNAGYRSDTGGALARRGISAAYWSSSLASNFAFGVELYPTYAYVTFFYRTIGASIKCIAE